MKQLFFLASFSVIIIINSCSINNSENEQKINSLYAIKSIGINDWTKRTLDDTSICGCGNFNLYKKIDSLGSNFWFAFEAKKDIDPIRSIISLSFPRDTSYFQPFLVDFSSDGHCLAPFCNEIFINIKPCEKGERFEILNGDALLFCSDGFREGNNSLNPKLYYVGALFHNLVFTNKKDTLKIKMLKMPAIIVGWSHG